VENAYKQHTLSLDYFFKTLFMLLPSPFLFRLPPTASILGVDKSLLNSPQPNEALFRLWMERSWLSSFFESSSFLLLLALVSGQPVNAALCCADSVDVIPRRKKRMEMFPALVLNLYSRHARENSNSVVV